MRLAKYIFTSLIKLEIVILSYRAKDIKQGARRIINHSRFGFLLLVIYAYAEISTAAGWETKVP